MWTALSRIAQMRVAYVDCTCHTWLKWAWLMWTAHVKHGSNGCGLCGQHLSHMTQMGMAYVDCTCHTWLKWAWLMWTALVTHGSNGRGLCGRHMHMSDMAQMGVANVDSTCHTWLKWAWLMWTALVTSLKWAWLMWTALFTHCSNGCGLCGQHLAEEQTNMAVPFCCINIDWPATCTSLQMENIWAFSTFSDHLVYSLEVPFYRVTFILHEVTNNNDNCTVLQH